MWQEECGHKGANPVHTKTTPVQISSAEVENYGPRSHHFIAVLRRRGTFWWPSQSSSAKMLDPEALPATARPGSPGSDDSAPASLRTATSSPSNSNSSEFAEPPSEAAVEAASRRKP